MTMGRPNHIPDIPPEKFKFVQLDREIVDSAFETEPIGYFKDALIRLRQNKASVVAFYIILVISFLAIFGQDFNPYTFRQQNPDRTNMPPRKPSKPHGPT